MAAPASATPERSRNFLEGAVESGVGNHGLAGYRVVLYASYGGSSPSGRVLGTSMTDGAGAFTIEYRLPPGLRPLLFVLAEKGSSMLASAIGQSPAIPDTVVVNELTTVATGTAFAQFIDGRGIRGNTFGMLDASQIAADMANPSTGAPGDVIANPPNGNDTSTLETFDTLANIVEDCVANVEGGEDCDELLDAATAPDGAPAETVLDAIANMTTNPANDLDALFALSKGSYSPALSEVPTSWLLFLKFTGSMSSAYASTNLMNGPGQVAIDAQGSLWINDNYIPVEPPPSSFDLQALLDMPPAAPPDYVACAGKRLLRFYPGGAPYAGMPTPTGYTGGGLSGAGFGITLDPRGDVWVGNFGFEAPVCARDPALAASHDSVSLFRPSGSPVSGPNGFTKGHIWWPQATMSDRRGNIWLANCGNDTVTMIPKGNPRQARNIPLPGGLGASGIFQPVFSASDPDTHPRLKPFAITIDPRGRAWVTGNLAGADDTGEPIGAVYRISPNGHVKTLPNTTTDVIPKALFSRPMGIVSDSKGNIWVSNSDAVDVPCVGPLRRHLGGNPSVAFISADGDTRKVYTGGGLTLPWGSAVDGDDTVWVFNFGTSLGEGSGDIPDTALSRFCGTGACPAHKKLGDPISPGSGYATDALDRVTGGAIGPSGAIVLLNNWQKPGPSPRYYNTSPGGNSFVIVPGAAAPVRTPLIGPPRSFGRPASKSHRRNRPH